MARSAFLKMLQVYDLTFGAIYPKRHPSTVFRVLEQCASPVGTTQVEISKATRLSATEVNRVVTAACKRGWISKEDGRTSGGSIMITLTEPGRQVLANFDQRCEEACRSIVSESQPNPKARRSRPVSAKGQPMGPDMFESDDEQQLGHGTGAGL